jgi:hypothetical protein
LNFLRAIVVIFLCCTFAHAVAAPASGAFVEPILRRAKSGVSYTIFPQGNLAMEFVVQRPSAKDANIALVIPAAFTTNHGAIDGIWRTASSPPTGSVNRELGGALVVTDGKCGMLATDGGAILNDAFFQQLATRHSALFQQFLIVENGSAASFKDKSKFQRRAIVEFTDKSTAIVESKESITFSRFNADLVELGARNAIYTDMGAWDEGWYRDAQGKIRIIGNDRSLTRKQSNWLIFRRR